MSSPLPARFAYAAKRPSFLVTLRVGHAHALRSQGGDYQEPRLTAPTSTTGPVSAHCPSMYLPSQFEQTDIDRLHKLIHERPLATLVSLSPEGLTANHIPFELDPHVGPQGTLRGHVARANPVWRDAAGSDVLLVFHGPQAYISPSWYPSKQHTHKAVPTWNYVVVHVHGKLQVIDDPRWMRSLLDRQTDAMESHRSTRWRVDEAPPDFLDQMMAAIVGVEVPIHSIKGKWKVSQNRTPADRSGVAYGLNHESEAGALEMRDLVLGDH